MYFSASENNTISDEICVVYAMKSIREEMFKEYHKFDGSFTIRMQLYTQQFHLIVSMWERLFVDFANFYAYV